MFKTIIAAGAVASVSAISGDLMSGFQTGVFLGGFDDFEDYSCPLPETSD